jgi:pimeloyl-ACP methyl ester carboxylesterase
MSSVQEGPRAAKSLPPVVIDGLSVSRRPGPGARVVFVHGVMDRAGGFAKVLRRLPELNLVRYDRRGYGDSQGGPLHDTLDGHVDDVLTVIGEQPSVVVGHSLGGILALAASIRRPDLVRAIAAYETPMPWSPWWTEKSQSAAVHAGPVDQDPEEAAERFLRKMLTDELWDRFPPSMKRARLAEGHALLSEMSAMAGAGVFVHTSDVTVPVVAAHGTRSKRMHVESARALSVEAADGELVVIEGAGHTAHYTHPDDFAAFVRRAVAKAERRDR